MQQGLQFELRANIFISSQESSSHGSRMVGHMGTLLEQFLEKSPHPAAGHSHHHPWCLQ